MRARPALLAVALFVTAQLRWAVGRLSRRITLFPAMPPESIGRLALEARPREFGREADVT